VARSHIVALAVLLVACGSSVEGGPAATRPSAPMPSASSERSAPERERASAEPPPSTGPVRVDEPPLPGAPTAPIACSALGTVGIYEGAIRAVPGDDGSREELVLTAQIAGPETDYGMPPIHVSVSSRDDLDRDGTPDVIGLYLADGEPDCGNWGDCVMVAAVRCDDRWATVYGPRYTQDISAGTTMTEHAGRRWRVLLEAWRLGDAELDLTPQGGGVHALELGASGYAGRTNALWLESERCAAFYREGRFVRARDMCEQGLAAHPRGTVRGALYYDLGRIAEAQGRIEEARDAYRRSLEARPGNAAVQGRLDALGAH
jgi:hypothetical protein